MSFITFCIFITISGSEASLAETSRWRSADALEDDEGVVEAEAVVVDVEEDDFTAS